MPKCHSVKFLCSFIEIALEHGRSPVNLLHIFRTPFLKNTSGWLLLRRSRMAKTVTFNLDDSLLISFALELFLLYLCFPSVLLRKKVE